MTGNQPDLPPDAIVHLPTDYIDRIAIRSVEIRLVSGAAGRPFAPAIVVTRIVVGVFAAACVVGGSLAGCAASRSAPSTGMSQALDQAASGSDQAAVGNSADADASTMRGENTQPTGFDRPGTATKSGSTIATVNGRPMSRKRVVDLLLRSGGVGVLEQLIVLDEAQAAAADRGLSISDADVQREYDSALRMLSDPLAGLTSGALDREAAERSLRAVLADRNISHDEFFLGMRRRAYLRRIVESTLQFSDEDLRTEFQRRYGERVQVRHIQLAVPRNVDRIRDRLAAGEDFAEMARIHSANLTSAEQGGLLQPFSRDDPAVPDLLRKTAFSLMVGEVSGALRIGDWVHLLKLERRLPSEPVAMESVRDALLAGLRERAIEPEMQRLYEKLFRGAKIVIHDPVLRTAFERAHPDHLDE